MSERILSAELIVKQFNVTFLRLMYLAVDLKSPPKVFGNSISLKGFLKAGNNLGIQRAARFLCSTL